MREAGRPDDLPLGTNVEVVVGPEVDVGPKLNLEIHPLELLDLSKSDFDDLLVIF